MADQTIKLLRNITLFTISDLYDSNITTYDTLQILRVDRIHVILSCTVPTGIHHVMAPNRSAPNLSIT